MSALRQVLEEAVLADPDDRAANMAYADYLTEQGDPRGELIQTQLALDLRHGLVTDEGALALAAHPATRKLERLDLQRNRLTSRGLEALQGAGITGLRLEYQQQPAADGTYDDQYLYDGDWE